MQKPDKVLRFRPLKEAQAAIAVLKRIVLFHPNPIVEETAATYCVCGKGVRLKGKKTDKMVQCDNCWEWYHFDCVGLLDDQQQELDAWTCEYCAEPPDQEGFNRWRAGRKKPKKRHHSTIPRLNGGQLGGEPPKKYSAPPSWDGKVAEVQEIARRAAVKKRKLRVAVEKLVDEGGHHLMDTEGMAGLKLRSVDEEMMDEMLVDGLVDLPNSEEVD